MGKYFGTDIKDKIIFKRVNSTYYRVYYDDDKHIAVYDIVRDDDGEHKGYEIVKGIKYLNPDGSICYRYPSDEDFGIYAWGTIGTEGTFDTEMEQILGKVKIIENRATPR